MGGDVFSQRLGHDGSQQVFVCIHVQPGNIDGEDDICWAPGPFGLQALCETLGSEDDIHLRAGLFGIGLDERIDQEWLTVGIDVEFLRFAWG